MGRYAARQRAQRIMALFQEKESRDELGLGAIRDSIGSVMPERLTEALERAIDEGLVRRRDASLLRAEIGVAA